MRTRTIRELGDATGRAKAEKLSEYFDFTAYPDKRDRRVTRGELLAILTRKWAVERESRWYRVLWRWLRSRGGSGPVVVPNPQPEDEHDGR